MYSVIVNNNLALTLKVLTIQDKRENGTYKDVKKKLR